MSIVIEFYVRINGKKAGNVPLVYEGVGTSLPTSPDITDESGYVRTKWHSDWLGKKVEVYCHTDGKNSGRPKYADTILISKNMQVDLFL